MHKRIFAAAAFTFLSLVVNGYAQQWRPLSGSRQSNISGMALIEHEKQHSSFLIVHDNKKKDQTHVAVITVDGADAPKYTPLSWIGDDVPVDLEAATSIPGEPGQFMIFTAAGRVYRIKIDLTAKTAQLIRSFDVPSIQKDADFEGFALQRIGDELIAVWADRGLTERPATLFWGRFDLAAGTFAGVKKATFKVPYPASDVRHISDVKVDQTGAVFVTSASDPGNDGPFSSAMYFAGVLRPGADKTFDFIQPAGLSRLFHFDYHKVEAFDFMPGPGGGVVFGTDDENLGAMLLMPE
ncbi:hypothetical protein BH10ACI2_BH10ACI2_12900 [soil metagenome]